MLKPGWLSEHFHISEFACHDTRGTPVPARLLPSLKFLVGQLEIIRGACGGNPVIIRSGYRTRAYNKAIGGATRSKHCLAQAADLVVVSRTPEDVHSIILRLIGMGRLHNGGVGKYANFTHYDCRAKPARWEG